MKHTINYTLADRMAIARSIVDNAPDEPATYDVEYRAGGYTLHVEVSHEYERLTEIYNEYYDIQHLECLNADGEEVEHNLSARNLSDILN